ncbi:hypothetical protein [Flavicella sediminum]|uniref:hypothetical protein n=1 Tax=Flavicella sediminum TaxID=2585141 RepID=UPI001AA09090|nr:hypothetical protein [Flavicella sediminum]
MKYIVSLAITIALFTSCSKSPQKTKRVENYKIEFGKVSPKSVFSNDTMSIWGGSLVKGEDNLYHMFYSRWPKAPGWVWVTHSEIAHAVSNFTSFFKMHLMKIGCIFTS